MSKKLYHQFACSSMMLPEHRGRLEQRRRQARREEEQRRPQFDEQQWEQFQYLLELSLAEGAPLRVTVLDGRGRRVLVGVARKETAASGVLHLQAENGVRKVAAAHIIDLKIHENSSVDGFD